MVRVWIDGKELKTNEILDWEQKRVAVSVKLLEKKTKQKISAANAEELARVKEAIPQDKMRTLLKGQLSFAQFGTGIGVRLSRGKRKISVAEIDVDFCNAQTLRNMYDDMMLNNTKENLRSCLRANPDHYLLRGDSETVQEVIEVAGGMPFVSRFFIHYGEFEGLQSKADADYPYQAAGISYLENGLAIGAVRHQMKDTDYGCHVKLAVEFPAMLPDKGIRAHQYHLACEFYNWFSEFERRVKSGTYYDFSKER